MEIARLPKSLTRFFPGSFLRTLLGSQQHASHWTLFDSPFLLHLESAAIFAASSAGSPSLFLSILAYLPLEGSSKYMMHGFTPFPNLHVHGWRLDYNAARIMVTDSQVLSLC